MQHLTLQPPSTYHQCKSMQPAHHHHPCYSNTAKSSKQLHFGRRTLKYSMLEQPRKGIYVCIPWRAKWESGPCAHGEFTRAPVPIKCTRGSDKQRVDIGFPSPTFSFALAGDRENALNFPRCEMETKQARLARRSPEDTVSLCLCYGPLLGTVCY